MKNKKLSKLSVVGLALAVLTPAILCLNFPLTSLSVFHYSEIQLIDFITNCLAIVLPVLALHISMMGVKDSKKKEKRGIIPGVAGVVISALEIAIFVVFVIIYNLRNIYPIVY